MNVAIGYTVVVTAANSTPGYRVATNVGLKLWNLLRPCCNNSAVTCYRTWSPVLAGVTILIHPVPWCRGSSRGRKLSSRSQSGSKKCLMPHRGFYTSWRRVPDASWEILYILIIAGRAVGLDTSNLGESWSVVMTVIVQVIDKLTRGNALLVLLQKRKLWDMMVEGSLAVVAVRL